MIGEGSNGRRGEHFCVQFKQIESEPVRVCGVRGDLDSQENQKVGMDGLKTRLTRKE
jgi:hypothetical protein